MFFHQTCISNNVSFKDKNSSCLRNQVARQHENPRTRRCGVPPTAMDSQKPRGRVGLWGLREMIFLGGILHHSSSLIMLKDSQEPPNDEISKKTCKASRVPFSSNTSGCCICCWRWVALLAWKRRHVKQTMHTTCLLPMSWEDLGRSFVAAS